MKNLLKENPKNIINLIMAILLVALSYNFILYFNRRYFFQPRQPEVTREEEKEMEKKVNFFEPFGAIYIETVGPSYARRNFDVDPNGPITVYYNERVNLDDAVDKFKLIKSDDDYLVPLGTELVGKDTEVEEEYLWEWQRYWVQKIIFTPKETLAPNTRYIAFQKPGFFNEARLTSANRELTYSFTTAHLPGVLSTNLEGEKLSKKDKIRITFMSPMDKEELLENITLVPLDEELMVNLRDKILQIENELSPQTEYTLTISGKTRDFYDRELGEDYAVTFSIR